MMKKFAFIFGIFIILVWFGGFVYFAWQINHYQPDTTTRTEAIIALTGGRYRIAEAVDLYNRGLADKLFISGVGRKSSLGAIKKRQNLHIDNENGVIIGKKAKNTIGNAEETIDWLKKNNISSIRLVTSNYHLARSVDEFLALSPQLKIIPHPVYSDKVRKRWWKSWHTFTLIFAEYNKFLYAHARCNFFRGV